MEFDHFTILFLATNPDGPDEVDPAVWDGHLAHLAALHASGELVAAGPVGDATLRGMCILTVAADRARELAAADPAVEAGVFTPQFVPWRVPKGVVVATAAPMPRSVAEASG